MRLSRRGVLATLRVALVVALMAAGIGGTARAAVQVDPAFGYRIGDEVVAVGEVVVDAGAKLDPASLPKTGRVNGWLSLEEVRAQPQPGGWQVVRTFQVTASAPEPRMLFLPKVQLKFTRDGREIVEQLESVPISVSPLASAEPILRTGFGAIRPDRDVPDPQAARALRNAGLLGMALAALALMWVALRAFAVRRRGYAPFALAAKQLRRSADARDDPDAVRDAYRVLHDAFNQWAGQAVFASQMEKFLADHPRFAGEAATVREFFERSRMAFFGVAPAAGNAAVGGVAGRVAEGAEGSAGAPDRRHGESELGWLYRIARRLARIEQPGR